MIRKCIICGQEFNAIRTQTRCPDCKDNYRVLCYACGKPFESIHSARPNGKRLCPVCLSQHRSAVSPQSKSTRIGLHDQRAAIGRNTIKAAQQAAKTHPKTAKNSPLNSAAKVWHLISPTGQMMDIRNLNGFIAQHPDDFPDPHSAKSTFAKMSRTLRDPDGPFRKAYSCRGWRLSEPASIPDDRAVEIDKIQKRNTKREQIDSSNHAQRHVNQIARLRQKKGITQAGLAQLLCVGVSMVARWEHSEYIESAPLDKIASILGTTKEALLSDISSPMQ